MDIINTWGRYSESFYLYLLAVFFDFAWVKSIIDSFKSSWKVGTWTSYWLLKNSTTKLTTYWMFSWQKLFFER